MKALITGACGFVGKHLAEHLLSKGDEVVGTVYQGQRQYPFPTFAFDITEFHSVRSVLNEVKPDIVYHLAAISFVPEAEKNFSRTLMVNVAGVENLCRAIVDLELSSRLLFVSSAEVYGKISPQDLPISERCSPCPMNNYSLSKLMAEEVVNRYQRSYGLQSVIMRPFNHIGPGQNDRFVSSSFARQLAQIGAGKMEAKLSVGNLTAMRDFTDVRDVVKAYRMAALTGSGVYNIASTYPLAIQTILETLIEISQLQVRVETDPARMRASEVPEIYGSYERAQNELGWHPEIPLTTTLRDIFEEWVRIEQNVYELLR
jgi:GDP-4-dehydro-6-deoxy-D-mannose reductase